ncbi:WD and tetratricopeptide repeats protein 1 [Onthophagus taurus]|uniref:WD and tetratricopeptide repeats protein 1 n=1 Tax=Onthophagus taurus TaxID=166361 RepID=UPI000C20EC7F|nr:WD and tetratricopeptide repeats protein 1 [Onthophagus taurus]
MSLNMYRPSVSTSESNRNIVNLLSSRQKDANKAKKVEQNCQFTEPLIRRLGLEKELEGHQGCVNCLEWSSDGRVLASGSDDTHVHLWDPFLHKCLNIVKTSHIGNIFSVKFLGDGSLIATGAGDCRVIVKSVDDTKANSPLIDCSCHLNRVKRLAKCPEQPLLFWSASEDGLVIQYDIRESHKCNVNSKVFIDRSRSNELKCIAINPTKPHLMAVGANDCYVRMYDRRMVKTVKYRNYRQSTLNNPETIGVQYFAPGHLAKDNVKELGNKYAATYVAFNASGSELLVNMGGEHIYLFDINNQRKVDELKIPEEFKDEKLGKRKINSELFANLCIEKGLKLFQRNWIGDMYQAARYYLLAIQQKPEQPKLYLSLINCLVHLKWLKETESWLSSYKKKFPEEDPKLTQIIEEAIEGMKSTINSNPNESSNNNNFGQFCENYEFISDVEKELRQESRDFELRFVGHCNTTTDIKEANFLGEDGNFVCAGSDDGLIFIWDRKSTEVLTALTGDTSIVNCVQPHPSACFLASSGIDPAVKLWAPKKEDGIKNPHKISEIPKMIEVNQMRMSMDPFETMMVNMGYRVRYGNADNSPNSAQTICRAS